MKICLPTVLLALLVTAFTVSCSDSGNGEATDTQTVETVVAEDVTDALEDADVPVSEELAA